MQRWRVGQALLWVRRSGNEGGSGQTKSLYPPARTWLATGGRGVHPATANGVNALSRRT